MIGKQGGRQQVSLGNGCGTVGVAIHEVMHALGFFHEQSRRDRDKYITVNFNNINRRKISIILQCYFLTEMSALIELFQI